MAICPTGTALQFDGVDDYVEIPDAPELRLLSTDFAIGAWIKPNSITTGVIISKRNYDINDGSGDNAGWGTLLREGELSFVIFGTAEYSTAGANIKTNTWQYVTYVFDNSNNVISVYKDGGFLENLHTAEISFSDKSVIIGAASTNYPGQHAPSNGTIDDVRIYDRALSPSEVWQIYQGELADLVGLEIIGPGEVPENFSASYKAIAYYDDNSTRDVTSLVSWAVEPNTYATIDENGVLTTKDIVKNQPATILASYTEGNVTFEAEKAIDIFPICPMGTALQFDGVDDYVDCGSDSSLDVTELTWALWIKRGEATYSNERALVSNEGGGNNTSGTYALQIDEGGSNQDRIQFVRHGDSYVLSNTAIQDTYWHHIAMAL
ncbi:hypothetical protein ES703_64368 [subsurface metagenome]